jgi:hypothetical protein
VSQNSQSHRRRGVAAPPPWWSYECEPATRTIIFNRIRREKAGTLARYQRKLLGIRSPYIKMFLVSQRLNRQSRRTRSPMHCRPQIRESNAIHIIQWDLQCQTRFDRLQLIDNPVH